MKVQDRDGENHRPGRRSGQDFVELWINLARLNWGSLVVIPADRGGSTAEIANALADIGQRLSYGPVTAITVDALEYGSALALADLQQHMERERRAWRKNAQTVEAKPARRNGEADPRPAAAREPEASAPEATASANGAPAAEASTAAADAPGQQRPEPQADPERRTEALLVVPPARLVISVPPIVSEPLGLAAAEKADAIVLAIRMNHSRMADVRRTIQLVGRSRISGCFIVR